MSKPSRFPHTKPSHLSAQEQMRKQNQSHQAIQPKLAATSQNPKQPVAPPAYRLQLMPQVLLRKKVGAQQPPQGQQSGRKPIAPPVFRPQSIPKCLQMKKHVSVSQRPNQVKQKTAPPPITRPEASPNVKRADTNHTATRRSPTVVQRMMRTGGGRQTIGVDMMKLYREEKAKRLAQENKGIKQGVQSGETKEQEKPPQKALVSLWLRQGHHQGDTSGAGYYLGDAGSIDVNNNGWLANLRYSLQITVGQPTYVGQWLHIIEVQGNVANYESYGGALNKGNLGGVDPTHVTVRADRQNQNNDTVQILEAWVVQNIN